MFQEFIFLIAHWLISLFLFREMDLLCGLALLGLELNDSLVSVSKGLRLQAWVSIPSPKIHHNLFNSCFYILHDCDKQLQVSS